VFFLFFVPILFAGLLLAAVFAFLFPLIGFMITLPFRILGWVLGLLGGLILLPIFLVVAMLGLGALAIAALFGGFIFFVPFVPFLVLALVVAFVVKRSHRHAARV